MIDDLNLLSERVRNINFAIPIPVGQLYFPSWQRYEVAFREIFDREYYNNNGPLLNELENKLQLYLGVKHVICTGSATLGLMIAAQALELSGKVIIPAHTFVATAQSLRWAGIEPVFCDVDQSTHHIDMNKLELLIDENVSGILAVNLWGGASDVVALEAVAKQHKLKLYFDSAQAFGCRVGDVAIGNFGHLEVFSFHATKILSAGEGGCVCTNDDELAARLKAIRPSYGDENSVDIAKVANTRMSEAQAAVALMNFEDLDINMQRNENIFNLYGSRLSSIDGITLLKPSGVSQSNFQSVVCHINENKFGVSRDTLIELLKMKNILARRYFYPGVHKTLGFSGDNAFLPVTDKLNHSTIQLPIGAFVDSPVVNAICDLIQFIQHEKDYAVNLFMESNK